MESTLAKICDVCPFCSYARKNPDSTFGKIISWHGSWCPAWKAWENVYGQSNIEKASVKETEPVTAAFLSMKGSYDQVSEAFSKLYTWMGEKGIQPAGPSLGIYFNDPDQVEDEELEWELLSPISDEIDPFEPDEDGVGVKRLERALVAATTHKGAYDGIGKKYEWLTAWISDQGYQIAGPAQEVYLKDPVTTSPKKLQTEIRFPVHSPA